MLPYIDSVAICGMTDQYLGPLVSGDEIIAELRHRKKKDVYKTVTGNSKKIIAKRVKLEEAGRMADDQKKRQVNADGQGEACRRAT